MNMMRRAANAKIVRKRKTLSSVSNSYFRRLIKENIHKVTQESCTSSEIFVNSETVPENPCLEPRAKNKQIEQSQTPFIENPEPVHISEVSTKGATELSYHKNERGHAESNTNNSLNIKEELANWIITFNINHTAANALLKLLKEHFAVDLPADTRSLLRTRTFLNKIIDIPPGSYWHFGIENGIKYAIKKNSLNIVNEVKLDINVDGLPLTKSSSSQLWPILGSILSTDGTPTTPFTIGIYHGNKKPESPSDLMREFIEEFNNIYQKFTFNDQNIQLILNNIICDAPAKAFLLGIKSYNAYFGCTKCIQEGSYIQGKITYPETDATLRTDDSFRLKLQEDFHKIVSPLEQIAGVGLVSQVPLDYMHLVCLGVMKKLILFWIKGKKDVRMLDTNIKKANVLINDIVKQVPAEFARRPRPLTEADRWKAAEFRLFLLYIGPIILNDTLLTNSQYTHFMTLHVAMRILVCKDLCIKYINYAQNLLIYFVQKYVGIYGPEHITHNVHNLIHLCADVLRNNGPLDNFSSFQYENYLQSIKKKIKCSKNPLQQIANRIQEEQLFCTSVDCNFPLIKTCSPSLEIPFNYKIIDNYRSVKSDKFTISLKDNNNCVMLYNNSIVLVKHIVKTENVAILLIGNKFNTIKPYFDNPCSSTVVYTYVAKNISSSYINFVYTDIKYKCFKIKRSELDDEFVVINLLHNIS